MKIRKRTVIIFISLLLPLITQCKKQMPVALDIEREPSKPGLLSAGTAKIVPGRVIVVLNEKLWKKEFRTPVKDIKPWGAHRLNMTKALAAVFEKYSIERVWRSIPQLEQPVKEKVRVISYPEWVNKRNRERGIRKNTRPYKAPQLVSMQGTFDLKFPEKADLDALLRDLRRVPGVISAEAVKVPIPDAPYFPNEPGWVASSDPMYNAELARGRWGFHNSGAGLASGYLDDFDIDAPEAWEFQQGDPQVVVAVFDDGVDVTHEDLYLNVFLNNGEAPSNIVSNHKGASADDGLPGVLTFYDLNVPSVKAALADMGWSDTNGNGYIDGEDVTEWWGDCLNNGNDGENCIDNDGNGFVDDLVGWDFSTGNNRPFEVGKGNHGTSVAGLIASVANNGKGIAGAAPRVRILPVRGTTGVEKIIYALSFPEVKVINESQAYDFSGNASDINALLSTLEPEGVIYIASYGNHNAYFNGFDPSRREQIVSISNFGPDGKRVQGYGGSTYGPKNDVAAPGNGMYSLKARTTINTSTGTSWFGGTSAASPVTAGVAALVASQQATLSPEQIRQVIRMAATDPAPVTGDMEENTPGWDIFSGWGLVNAKSAITAVGSGTVHPEANILSLPMTYLNSYREEGLAIHLGTVPMKAYMGLPGGGTVDWTLRRSLNWDMSGAVQEATQSGAVYSNGTTALHAINTDGLDNGRHVFELAVTTPQGVSGKDRAVIDLLRAYISNLKQGQLIVDKFPIEGFAFGPGFTQYRILVAPGWSPAPTDFTSIYSSTNEQRPALPTEPGEYLETAKTLLAELDIFSLPVTLPASGEATIRVETRGTSTWTFDEEVIIDNTQPPQQAGFPANHDVLYADYVSGAPTASDLDGDGDNELIIAGLYYIPAGNGSIPGKNTIHVLQSDGMPLTGWPVYLPFWEFPSESITVGDVDGDGRQELVVRSRIDSEKRWCVRIFNHDGTEVQLGCVINFNDPRWSNGRFEHNSPVLSDVSLDGKLDILLALPKSEPEVPAAQLRAYTYNGTAFEHIVSYLTGSSDHVSQSASGDIDGDGENEIIAVGYSSTVVSIYVWKQNGTLAWSRDIDPPTYLLSRVHPVLMDVDNDGVPEIITTGGLWKVHIYDGNGTLLASSSQTNPHHIYLHPAGAQFRPGTAPNDFSVVYAYRAFYTPGGNTYAGIAAIDALTGNVRSGWPAGVKLADGNACNSPVIADFQGDGTMEIAASNCPPDSSQQSEPLYHLSIIDDLGNILSDGNKWPLIFPTPVASTPLVTDLDRDGDLELVVQTQGYNARIYAYDLSSPSGPGRIAWGEYGHDPRKSGNYHGDLHILSPNTVNPVAIRTDTGVQTPLLVRVNFSRGIPAGATNLSRWKATIGNQEAVISQIIQSGGECQLTVQPVAQPAGTYKLRMEFEDGGIKTWDAYRDAIIYYLASETRITNNPALQGYASIDGNKIVYHDNRNGNFDIYMYDMETRTETRITTNTANQGFPDISGDKVVWHDERNGNHDIYMYDLKTDTERQITTNPAVQREPAISGDKIVWHDNRNGNWDIYMYDVTTNSETQITTNLKGQVYADISGNRIVYQDIRDGNLNIYMYDLASGRERQITADPKNQMYPKISGDKIVWYDNRNVNLDIYMYNLVTGSETQITHDTHSQFDPAISGDRIVWNDNRNGAFRIYMYDVKTGAETQLTLSPGSHRRPSISGNKIAYHNELETNNWEIYVCDLSIPL